MPGDSPVGFRLPLGSLPYVPPVDDPHLVPADPFAERGALPDPPAMARAFAGGRPRPAAGRAGARRAAKLRARKPPQPAPIPVRTALAVEPRDGRLCVFMPPVERLEDYLELLAAVEATAAELNLPIHIEGYPPPPDPRLNVIKVTPDPGVIEVNIHPAASWREAVEITAHALRGGAAVPARRRQVHDRRPPHRHRRRQPCRARRRGARRTARSCAGPIC